MAITREEALKKLDGCSRSIFEKFIEHSATKVPSYNYLELLSALLGMTKDEDLQNLVDDILFENKTIKSKVSNFEKEWEAKYEQVSLDPECYSHTGPGDFMFTGGKTVDFFILTKDEIRDLVVRTEERASEYQQKDPLKRSYS